MSPSASSLDSGYCGPASVQSSIDSPHNNLGYPSSPHSNLGYPSSPWTTNTTEHPNTYYMHSTENGHYHNSQQDYVMPSIDHKETNFGNSSQDQDISHIVDQVLSCIDQLQNDEISSNQNNNDSAFFSTHHPGHHQQSSAVAAHHRRPPLEESADNNRAADFSTLNATFRDGLETVLCHNCGALMSKPEECSKNEDFCRQCGAQFESALQRSSNSSSVSGAEDNQLKSTDPDPPR